MISGAEGGREVLERVIELVGLAASKTLEVYEGNFGFTRKGDGSPLTEADLASHRVLVAGLAQLTDSIPVISEESPNEVLQTPTGKRFWLVDPLDGTKEFVRRTGEFTINVALIVEEMPALGVVSAPALDTVYAGIVGQTAFRIDPGGQHTIEVNNNVDEGLVVVGSRSHGSPELMKQFLEGRKVREFMGVGSSLKFCRLAEGAADLYPRFGRTMEWDTAAGHAVLTAAGGAVETLEGEALRYGKPGLANPHFIARSGWVDAT